MPTHTTFLAGRLNAPSSPPLPFPSAVPDTIAPVSSGGAIMPIAVLGGCRLGSMTACSVMPGPGSGSDEGGSIKMGATDAVE